MQIRSVELSVLARCVWINRHYFAHNALGIWKNALWSFCKRLNPFRWYQINEKEQFNLKHKEFNVYWRCKYKKNGGRGKHAQIHTDKSTSYPYLVQNCWIYPAAQKKTKNTSFNNWFLNKNINVNEMTQTAIEWFICFPLHHTMQLSTKRRRVQDCKHWTS